MKLVNEQATGFWSPRPPSLDALLRRLEAVSLKPEFALQHEVALARALRPYLEGGTGRVIAPLPQESELASLSLFCDFYPEDGQLSLIEQLRDVITEHIPNEERVWLDPLKHSYLDLLKLTATPVPDGTLALQSIGDGTTFEVPGGDFAQEFVADQVLLTRVIRDPAAYESGKGYLAGCGIVLTPADANLLLERTGEWRQEMEAASGSFALSEWQEFAKRYGYMLLWTFAELRFAALVDAVVHVRYRLPDGRPYLYAVALYDHHEYRLFAEGLSGMNEFEEEPQAPRATGQVANGDPAPARIWAQRDSMESGTAAVARLTLTSSQLIVECDGAERLDQIKHRLAGAFGFSLHFRGESVTPPARQLTVAELMAAEPLTVVVTPQEDQALLNQFLEKAYLEWADQPNHTLGGQTPRHAAVSSVLRDKVKALIDDMERHDPGVRRSGKAAFSYNTLRAHVGLDEVPE